MKEYNVRRGGTADQLAQDTGKLLASTLTNGALLADTIVRGGVTTTIGHGLNRRPKSWLACRPRTAAPVYEVQPPDDRNVYLTAPSDQTIDLWVFG